MSEEALQPMKFSSNKVKINDQFFVANLLKMKRASDPKSKPTILISAIKTSH